MGRKAIDLTGHRYSRMTVLSKNEEASASEGRPMWNCACDCGETRVLAGNVLRRGTTKSCGCFQIEMSRKKNSTHGLSKNSPHFGRWSGIKSRCFDPTCHAYHNYGGRGITLYEPWIKDFKAFHDWLEDNLGPCPEGYSIDRIDNDGNYEPGNLRWASRYMQTHNRRCSKV